MTAEEQIIKSSEDFVEFLGEEIKEETISRYKKEGKHSASIYLNLVAGLSIYEITKYLHGLSFHHYAVANKLNWPEWEPGIFDIRKEDEGIL